MELKSCICQHTMRRCRPFNRTAYGIEIAYLMRRANYLYFLLIAPLMELKYAISFVYLKLPLSFNRTAYGIEMPFRKSRRKTALSPFNRTAYGIEINEAQRGIHEYLKSFNRTAYGIEMKIIQKLGVAQLELLIAPLMELK